MIWLIRKHPYTGALIYFKKIFHFLTFQTSKLPKTVAKKTKNMTSFPCSVRPEKFHPYKGWLQQTKKTLKTNTNKLENQQNGSKHIWLEFLKVDIFQNNCHFFQNFNACLRALLALNPGFQIVLVVNHIGCSRKK